MSIISALRRTGRVIGSLPVLPRVVSPLDTRAPLSELSPRNYQSLTGFLGAARAALLPDYDPFRPVPVLPVAVPGLPPIRDHQGWYFINGICTNRQVLNLNGKALAELFDREVFLLHNPSDGFLLDLIECAFGRTMQLVSDLDHGIAGILHQAVQAYEKVVVIAHSQGGIIGTNALYLLAHRLNAEGRADLLGKLEYYTFASAATEFKLEQVYSEHFFHTDDYVARIGVAGYPDAYTGHLYEAVGSGHLMNTHYLPALRLNRYRSQDGTVSRLLTYVPKVSVTREAGTGPDLQDVAQA